MARDEAPFTATLCALHKAWLVDGSLGERLPAGWRGMVDDAFEDIAAAVGGAPHILHRLEEESGLLVLELAPAHPAWMQAAPLHPDVASLVERTTAHARRTCQACGSPGSHHQRPYPVTLCVDHHERLLKATGAAEQMGDGASRRERPKVQEPRAAVGRVQLYRLDDVSDALGRRGARGASEAGQEQVSVLEAILEQGEAASWRSLAEPGRDQFAALDGIDRCAPHFAEVTTLVRRHLRAAMAMGTPVTLPALLLRGEPGFGKTWYVGKLASALGLPSRSHPMNSSSLGDGLMGSHAVWRNARSGLVARMLLDEDVANGIVLVDEFDKPSEVSREDPYRPFYTVLEPRNAAELIDEYLGFPLDASHLSWILACNETDRVPAAILDRVTVMRIPIMDEAQRRSVASSVYEEGNAARRHYFHPVVGDDVVDRLASLTARGMRRALGEAMVRAAADGRRTVEATEVVVEPPPTRRRIGF